MKCLNCTSLQNLLCWWFIWSSSSWNTFIVISLNICPQTGRPCSQSDQLREHQTQKLYMFVIRSPWKRSARISAQQLWDQCRLCSLLISSSVFSQEVWWVLMCHAGSLTDPTPRLHSEALKSQLSVCCVNDERLCWSFIACVVRLFRRAALTVDYSSTCHSKVTALNNKVPGTILH